MFKFQRYDLALSNGTNSFVVDWQLLFLALCLLIVALSNFALSKDYYGTYLGKLENSTYGVSGDVYLANETAIQVVNFNIEPQSEDFEISFVVATSTDVFPVLNVYKDVRMKIDDDKAYIIPIKLSIENGIKNERIYAMLPNLSSSYTYFGLISVKLWKYLAKVKINKVAPKPYCCLKNDEIPSIGIKGLFYEASTGPITILDAKTVLLKSFSLDGTKAPDGWIFAGKGPVVRMNGQKAMVIGQDSPSKQCSLRENYRGDSDLMARLLGSQTVYNIDFLSIFCYQYDVDFGHIKVKIPSDQPVPAFIPSLKKRKVKNKNLINRC